MRRIPIHLYKVTNGSQIEVRIVHNIYLCDCQSCYPSGCMMQNCYMPRFISNEPSYPVDPMFRTAVGGSFSLPGL
jgi:hypothetical protein